MGSYGRNRYRLAVVLIWLMVLAGCLSRPPSELELHTTEQSSATSMPYPFLTTPIQTISVSTPTIQVIISASLPTISQTTNVTPADSVPAIETAIPSETPPPGWIIYKGVPEGSGFPDVIYILRENGIGRRRILDNDNSGWEHPQALSWSPNGQWISFIASPYPSESRHEIYLVRPDGSELHRLTHTPGYKGAGSWSPDGKSIVYSQITGKFDQAEADLFVVEVDSGWVRQITHTPDIYEHNPAYSPQGDSIAYTAIRADEKHGTADLMIMDLDGGRARRLVDTGVSVGGIAWSPDGERIAFSSSSFPSENCDEDLYLVNRNGSGLQRLTDNPWGVSYPSWSPDSQWIAFETSLKCGGRGRWQINLIKTNGSGLREVVNPSPQYPNPAWSPLPALRIGEMFKLTESGAQLKLRISPSLSAQMIERLIEGEQILIQEGPIEADEYLWWRVRVGSNNQEGWVAENPGWFAPVRP